MAGARCAGRDHSLTEHGDDLSTRAPRRRRPDAQGPPLAGLNAPRDRLRSRLLLLVPRGQMPCAVRVHGVGLRVDDRQVLRRPRVLRQRLPPLAPQGVERVGDRDDHEQRRSCRAPSTPTSIRSWPDACSCAPSGYSTWLAVIRYSRVDAPAPACIRSSSPTTAVADDLGGPDGHLRSRARAGDLDDRAGDPEPRGGLHRVAGVRAGLSSTSACAGVVAHAARQYVDRPPTGREARVRVVGVDLGRGPGCGRFVRRRRRRRIDQDVAGRRLVHRLLDRDDVHPPHERQQDDRERQRACSARSCARSITGPWSASCGQDGFEVRRGAASCRPMRSDHRSTGAGRDRAGGRGASRQRRRSGRSPAHRRWRTSETTASRT